MHQLSTNIDDKKCYSLFLFISSLVQSSPILVPCYSRLVIRADPLSCEKQHLKINATGRSFSSSLSTVQLFHQTLATEQNTFSNPGSQQAVSFRYYSIKQQYAVPVSRGHFFKLLRFKKKGNKLPHMANKCMLFFGVKNYFQGKFNFHGCFWDRYPISTTNGRNLTKTENAQNALK